MLRGMIDEYAYDQARSRFFRSTWKRGRAVVVALAAIAVFVMQLAAVILAARGKG